MEKKDSLDSTSKVKFNLHDLPPELINRIAAFLPARDLVATGLACQSLNQAVTHRLRKNLIQHFFPSATSEQLKRIEALSFRTPEELLHDSFPGMSTEEIKSIEKLDDEKREKRIRHFLPHISKSKLKQIKLFFTYKENNFHPLLHPELLPLVRQLQAQELAPLLADIQTWAKKAEFKKGSTLFLSPTEQKANLQRLVDVFLAVKTNNLKPFQSSHWNLFNLSWLLHLKDSNHLTAFNWAEREGHQRCLNLFFKPASFFVNFQQFTDSEPAFMPLDDVFKPNGLVWAIACGQAPGIFLKGNEKKVLSSRLESTNELQENALHHAARNAKPDWLHYLLSNLPSGPAVRGRILGQKDHRGQTPLLTAAELGHWSAVSLLLQKGADSEGLSALMEKAPEPHPGQSRQTTPFHIAAQHLSTEFAITFIEERMNISIDAPDAAGKTLLHMACDNGDLNLARYLIGKGANLTQVDDEGWSAVHFAIKGNNIKLLKWLLEQWQQPVAATGKGFGIAQMVALYGSEPMFNLCLDDILQAEGQRATEAPSPLLLALSQQERHQIALKIIEKLPASMRLPSHYMHVAAREGFPYVDALVRYVEDINQADANGDTPLHLATLNQQVQASYQLLKAGAKIDVKNNRDQLAATHALKSKNPVLIALFALKTFGEKKPGWFNKKPSPEKLAAARALQDVVFGHAEPRILTAHQNFYTGGGSKRLGELYGLLMPLAHPGLNLSAVERAPQASSSA